MMLEKDYLCEKHSLSLSLSKREEKETKRTERNGILDVKT